MNAKNSFNAANILTGIRVICGILILFFPAFSVWYYSLYLLGGLSDAADGAVARKMGIESDFGAKFDTASDIIFALSVLIKIISVLIVPAWLMIWAGIIMLIKIINICLGFRRCHCFTAVHSLINKICGIAVFAVGLFIGGGYAWQAKALVVIAACIIATAAAVHECVSICRQ